MLTGGDDQGKDEYHDAERAADDVGDHIHPFFPDGIAGQLPRGEGGSFHRNRSFLMFWVGR